MDNKNHPFFTICIPAYNRAALLEPLLLSIISQDFKDFEILICEDKSPERPLIADIVVKYQTLYPALIRYKENENNLGYDGNIRRLVEQAFGKYCVFMGNDDLLCQGALQAIAFSINKTPNCGVVVRSYASFDTDPNNYKQVFRYFPQEYALSGAKAMVVAYRRSVVISGMVVARDLAHSFATSRFDGTLLYQLYLIGMILAQTSVVFIPQIISLRRDGNLPDFGNSASERGKFVPHDQTPESSIHFVKGMLQIAQYLEEATKQKVFNGIFADIANYSYPILSIQAHRSLRVFIAYWFNLAKMGFWRYPLFYLYFVALLILGPYYTEIIINTIKRRLKCTPYFGLRLKGKFDRTQMTEKQQ